MPTVQAFQSDDTPAALVKKAPGDPNAAPVSNEPQQKSIVEENSEGFEFDARLLWPVGVGASGALLFALSKIDEGFGDMLEKTLSRVRPLSPRMSVVVTVCAHCICSSTGGLLAHAPGHFDLGTPPSSLCRALCTVRSPHVLQCRTCLQRYLSPVERSVESAPGC
jgi:hypothetical protein